QRDNRFGGRTQHGMISSTSTLVRVAPSLAVRVAARCARGSAARADRQLCPRQQPHCHREHSTPSDVAASLSLA
ncbi:MAG: hypothetical protein ACRDTX_28450, partial [Pseudonocardiaceae bacterium]